MGGQREGTRQGRGWELEGLGGEEDRSTGKDTWNGGHIAETS